MTIRTRLARLLRRAALRLDPPPPMCAGHPSTVEDRPDLYVVRPSIRPLSVDPVPSEAGK